MWEKLRKFGMGHCDLPTMVWNVAFMLRGLTLNIDTRYKGSIPPIFFVLTLVLFFCYTYVYIISMAWFVFRRCIETGDITAAMIIFSLGITSEIGVAKYLITCIYRKKIRVLIEEYLKYDVQTAVAGSRFSGNLLLSLRSVKRRALIYWAIIVGNGILYIIQPLLTPGQTSIEDIFILYKLEPKFETPNYQLDYLITSLGCVLTCHLTSNMAAFLIVFAGYVESQLLALSEELLNLWDDAELQYDSSAFLEHEPITDGNEDIAEAKYNYINNIVQLKLRDVVIGHTTMINLFLRLDGIFRGAFVFEFFILSVGLVAELLGGLQNTYMQVPFAIIQVGMDCLTGQRVIDACKVFEDAVYSCKWERFNNTNMKTVLIMLINSQKTLTLSAGGIAILSFITLMSVFKSIYSAFTTLQSVM